MTAPHHVIHIILFFTFFFFAKDNPPLTKSDNTITGHFSFLLCHGLSPSAEPGTTQRRGEKYIIAAKSEKNFARCSYRGAASIHQRHSLRVRRAPAAPGAPLLHLRAAPLVLCLLPLPISKLTQSSSREDGGGEEGEKTAKVCGAQVLINGESKVKKEPAVPPVRLRPLSLWTRCAVSGTGVEAHRGEGELR